MGLSSALLAFKGITAEQVHTRLGLRVTGRVEDDSNSDINSTLLPSQWYLLVLNREEFKDSQLQELSSGCELFYQMIEEHVMYSAAKLWSDCQLRWAVEHNGEEGGRELKVAGDPPKSFDSIRDELMEAQSNETDEVDHVFDIPVRLGKEVLGFTIYDGESDTPKQEFQILERTERRKKLFGIF